MLQTFGKMVKSWLRQGVFMMRYSISKKLKLLCSQTHMPCSSSLKGTYRICYRIIFSLFLSIFVFYYHWFNRDANKSKAIMTLTMDKLTVSISKSVDILTKNPVLVLGLKRGYTIDDVKKSYRSLALKYHPGNLNNLLYCIIFLSSKLILSNITMFIHNWFNVVRT